MLRNPITIISFLILSAILAYLYFQYRIPSDIVTLGDNTETVALIALYTSIVSLLTAIVGLIQKIIEK